MIYHYDGSYPGFLCCVFESFVRKALPLAIEGPEAAQLSFFEGREIPTEAKKAVILAKFSLILAYLLELFLDF